MLATPVLRRLSARSYSFSRPTLARVLATDGVDDICVKIFRERGHTVLLHFTINYFPSYAFMYRWIF